MFTLEDISDSEYVEKQTLILVFMDTLHTTVVLLLLGNPSAIKA
jgi:hypothetical protein